MQAYGIHEKIKQHLAPSSLGHSDPLRSSLKLDPNFQIISTDSIKLTPRIRTHMESIRPKTLHVQVKKVKHLAVIVPYRDRKKHLDVFLPHIQNHLKEQEVTATIYLVEQPFGQPFNRGMIKNIGAYIANLSADHDFLCFHDIDLLPIDILFSTLPLHPCRPFHYFQRHDNHYLDICPEKTFTESYFGGILTIPTNCFKKVNGYSNKYWGWGCEDDDLLIRFFTHGEIPIVCTTASITNQTHPHAATESHHALLPKYIQKKMKPTHIRNNRKRLRQIKRGLLHVTDGLSKLNEESFSIIHKETGFCHALADPSIIKQFFENK